MSKDRFNYIIDTYSGRNFYSVNGDDEGSITPPDTSTTKQKLNANDIMTIIEGGKGIIKGISEKRQEGLRMYVKNACGRKPLFGKGKKAEYQKCAERVVNEKLRASQPPPSSTPSGMSTGTKVAIGALIFLTLGGITFMVVKSNQMKSMQPIKVKS